MSKGVLQIACFVLQCLSHRIVKPMDQHIIARSGIGIMVQRGLKSGLRRLFNIGFSHVHMGIFSFACRHSVLA